MARLISTTATIEPPEPSRPMDSTIVGYCPICGEAIYYGDDDIFVIEGVEQMIHEDCMVFAKYSLGELLDLLGVDRYKTRASEIFEEGY